MIISEILTDFENNEELGMIFPEKYYKSLIYFGDRINRVDIKYLNTILSKINPQIHVSTDFFDFPEANIFWAKVVAIYSIFHLDTNFLFTRKFRLINEGNLEKI